MFSSNDRVESSAAMSQPTVTLTIYIPRRWGRHWEVGTEYCLVAKDGLHVGSYQSSCASVDCGTSGYCKPTRRMVRITMVIPCLTITTTRPA
jgi:hypothetical protein